MDTTNFTPLPDSFRKQESHHIKMPDVMLVLSFVIFVFSVGFWVQSTILQPQTNATQKIIDKVPSPTATPEITPELTPEALTPSITE